MSLRRSLAWMLLSQIGLFVLQFGSSVVLARLLTPYDMGIYTAAASVVGILSVLQAFGITSFVVREPTLDRATLASCFTMNAMIAIVLALAIAGLSPVGAFLMHAEGVGRVLRLLAIIPLFGIVEFLPAANLEREGKFRDLATVNLVRSVAGTCVTVVLAFAGHSYMSIAWGGIASAVVGAAAFMIVGRSHVSFRFGTASAGRILTFGLQQLAIQGVNGIAGRLSEFMMGRLLGLAALGIYGRASNLNNIIWSNIHLVIGRVVFVDFAEQTRRNINLRDSYLRLVEIMTALLWPSFAGLAILGAPLIELIYGERWVAAAPPLAFLAVAAMLLVSITMTWELFVVSQDTARQARIEFLRSGVGTLLFLGGCMVSLSTAAAARVGEAAFSIYLYRPHLDRMTSTQVRDFLPIYGRSAMLTVVACGPSLALMSFYRWSAHIPFGLVLASVAIGVTGWLIGLMALEHPLFTELRHLAARYRLFRRAVPSRSRGDESREVKET